MEKTQTHGIQQIMMNRLSFIIGFSLLNAAIGFSQNEGLRWGKLSEAELNLKEYDKSPSAGAVVLNDYGEITASIQVEGIRYHFRRHKRIKILKESGNYSEVEIPYMNYMNAERLSNLKAQIISPEGKKKSLNKKDITEVQIDTSWAVQRFKFPEAVVGSILEYRYEIVSDQIKELRPWIFQGKLPVLHSEIRIAIPEWLEYVSVLDGNIESMIPDKDEAFAYEVDDDEPILVRDPRVKVRTSQYQMNHVMPLQLEAYMTNLEDYRAKIQFYLSKIHYPNGMTERYLPSWEEYGKSHRAMQNFGQQYLDENNFTALLNAAKNVVKSGDSKAEKIKAYYDFLNSTVEWNQEYSIYSEGTLDEAFKAKTASSGALNMMLIALLRQEGITAEPLLVSTRANGKMNQQYPIPEQFNHLLVHVIQDDESALVLDLADIYRPVGYPRVEALNSYGWLLGDEEEDWITLDAPSGSELMVAEATLKENGWIIGTFKNKYIGYLAAKERSAFSQKKDGAYWTKRFERVDKDAKVLEFKGINFDQIDQPFQTEFQFSLPQAVTFEQDKMIFSPVLFTRYAVSNFISEERFFPVDINYPFKEQFVMELKLPNGYEVESMPESVRVIIRGEGGTFNYILNEKEGAIQIISKIQVKQLKYLSESYGDVKDFFDIISQKVNEKIVLRKVNKE